MKGCQLLVVGGNFVGVTCWSPGITAFVGAWFPRPVLRNCEGAWFTCPSCTQGDNPPDEF